jgi:di/tricarboxylate transporter
VCPQDHSQQQQQQQQQTTTSCVIDSHGTAGIQLPSDEKDNTWLPSNDEDSRQLTRLRETFKGYTLGITYAANTGGSATLIGTVTNITMKGYLDEYVSS